MLDSNVPYTPTYVEKSQKISRRYFHLDKKQNPAYEDVPEGIKNCFGKTTHLRGKWICIIPFLIILGLQPVRRASFVRKDRQRDFESIISHDYANVDGIEDLYARSNLVVDKCYPGSEKKCTCGDPIEGSSREGQIHWLKASHENADNAKDRKNEIDVVFFGDSITEGWKGTSLGLELKGMKDKNAEYESLFTLDGGGKYEGLVLGIGGDTVSNTLAIAC